MLLGWLKKFLGSFGRFFAPRTEVFLLGRHGERLASRFLKKKGYKILRRNWRYGHSELDLIAVDTEVLVFVEVRLRQKAALVHGIGSISRKKKFALKRACLAYLKKFAPNTPTYRFDVIDIEHDSRENTDTIFHFENVELF